MTTLTTSPGSRQARFLPSAILPQGLRPDVWYNVCAGRRHDDNRPGMVLLDLGKQRMHFPEACLEFRDRKRGWRPAVSPRKIVRARRSMMTTAASLVPVAAALVVAINRLSEYRQA